MLTASDALRTAGRRRPPPSLTELYNDYVLQRIEIYKNSMERDDLLRLADEAMGVSDSDESQFVLTEMLACDLLDDLIKKKLKLKSKKKLGEQLRNLRAAQKEPTHWGLDGVCPVVPLLPRLEPTDQALVVGPAAEACAFLLAAHDVDVKFWASEMGMADRVEQRAATESLATRCNVCFGSWVPTYTAPFNLIVVDLGALAELDSPTRFDALRALQAQTHVRGLHVLLPSSALVPEAVFTFYDGWEREETPRRKGVPRQTGCILVKPAPPTSAEHRKAARA